MLFYRRRSDKPLGPQYLQDLVTDYRTSKDTNNEDDSDSGEGRLGGLLRSQRGSSSALAGVGAGVMSSQDNSGSGGAGLGNSLMGMSSAPAWDFDTLGEKSDDETGSTTAQGDEVSTSYREREWSPADAAWQSTDDDPTPLTGNSPIDNDSPLHFDTNDMGSHVEDAHADDDRITEIQLNADSSEHAEPEGLD